MGIFQLSQLFGLPQPWGYFSYPSYSGYRSHEDISAIPAVLGYRSHRDVSVISAIGAIAAMEISQSFQLIGLPQPWRGLNDSSYLGYRSHKDVSVISAV